MITAIAMLQDAFWPTDTVIGGGNAKLLDPLPHGCRRTANQDGTSVKLTNKNGAVQTLTPTP